MRLEEFKKIAIKRPTEIHERTAILELINCSRSLFTVEDIRFGDVKLREADIIIKAFYEREKICKTLGIEITEAFKNPEQARSKRDVKFIPGNNDLSSSLDELVQKIRERIVDKTQNKKYDKSNLDELVLLVVNEMDVITSPMSNTPRSFFSDGTPVGGITSIQRAASHLKSKNKAGFDRIQILTKRESNSYILSGVNFS